MTASTQAICLKGRREEFGPSLDLPAARDVVWVGRRCTMGGWDLPKSPWHNPHRAQRVGGAAKAVEAYFGHLRDHPELVVRARRELVGKRLACFCATDDPQQCHAALLAVICDLRGESIALVFGDLVGGEPS